MPGKSSGKRELGRPRYRRADNIKIAPKNRYEGVD
jgi:hypothetical protein